MSISSDFWLLNDVLFHLPKQASSFCVQINCNFVTTLGLTDSYLA